MKQTKENNDIQTSKDKMQERPEVEIKTGTHRNTHTAVNKRINRAVNIQTSRQDSKQEGNKLAKQ